MQRKEHGGKLTTINAREAAQFLGMNLHTLYRFVREGRLPAIRLGRSVRFRVAALEEWMQEQERGAAAKTRDDV